MRKTGIDPTTDGAVRTPIKVAIIDDEALMRRALARLMRSAGIEPLTFSSPREFLKDNNYHEIDCAITDLRMPDFDGLRFQDEINKTAPHLSLVFITGHADVAASVKAMKSGAVDFLEKPVDSGVLLAAIVRAAERSRALKVLGDQFTAIERRYETLTHRQRQVFASIAGGSLNKQAASDLGITEKTVKVHRACVMEKMKAGSLAELARMAERLGVRSADVVKLSSSTVNSLSRN